MSCRALVLSVGYVFSAMTIIFLLSIHLAALLFLSYLPSVILRGIGWIRLGRKSGHKIFAATGLIVLVLGSLIFLIILLAGEISKIEGLPKLEGIEPLILMWAVYSSLEATSYAYTGRKFGRKLAYLACVSVVGIVLALYLALVGLEKGVEILLLGILGVYHVLLVSLLVSCIGAILTYSRG